MAIPQVDFFDAIGKVAGLTGKQVVDIATTEGNPAIWSILEQSGGPLSKWNIIRDEAGNIGSIITGNGQFFNFTDNAVGAVTEYVGGNQLITDVAVSSNEMTVFTGDIIDAETQTVTKKGLLAGATTGANILSSAFAALGGVMTGVKWYQDNPQFWSDLSQKLLPFAYDDPTDKSWSDVLYEGLFPTAVDSNGNTYVQEKFLSELSKVLLENGFYDAGGTTATAGNELTSYITFDELRNAKIPVLVSNEAEIHRNDIRYGDLYDSFKKLDNGELHSTVIWGKDLGNGNRNYLHILASKTPSSPDGNSATLSANGTEPILTEYNINESFRLEEKDYYKIFYALWNQWYAEQGYITTYPDVGRYVSENETFSNEYNDFAKQVALIMLFGNITTTGDRPENTGIADNSTIPQSGKTLAETYPDWYKNALTSVDPNSTADNVQYITWLPLTIDNTSNDTQGTTELTQEQAQQGKPSENAIESFLEWLQQAYQTQTLPKPETEQAGNSGTETEPPEPEDGGSSGVPVITGAANALWKIYNPSLATLQQFGSWLWSSDPIKMIKEIFSNQPIDGIIGLHAIYVTPQTGDAENIKVGYIDSGVPAPVVTSQYIRFSCGTIDIPLYYQNALDFAYTKVLIYLPFIGIEELDSYDVMGKTLEVVYSVDVLTGIVLAQIIVSAPNYKATLYQFNGSCGVEYPLSSGSRSSQMLSLITGAVGGAAIGGIGGAVLGGVRGAATGANVRMSGNLAGNAGAMGIRKPFIIVKRPIEIAANNYNEIYGFPANITGKLKSFSGFTRIKAAHVDNIPRATAAEKDRILSALQTGVIL